jgi:hypothetical protein
MFLSGHTHFTTTIHHNPRVIPRKARLTLLLVDVEGGHESSAVAIYRDDIHCNAIMMDHN